MNLTIQNYFTAQKKLTAEFLNCIEYFLKTSLKKNKDYLRNNLLSKLAFWILLYHVFNMVWEFIIYLISWNVSILILIKYFESLFQLLLSIGFLLNLHTKTKLSKNKTKLSYLFFFYFIQALYIATDIVKSQHAQISTISYLSNLCCSLNVDLSSYIYIYIYVYISLLNTNKEENINVVYVPSFCLPLSPRTQQILLSHFHQHQLH